MDNKRNYHNKKMEVIFMTDYNRMPAMSAGIKINWGDEVKAIIAGKDQDKIEKALIALCEIFLVVDGNNEIMSQRIDRLEMNYKLIQSFIRNDQNTEIRKLFERVNRIQKFLDDFTDGNYFESVEREKDETSIREK